MGAMIWRNTRHIRFCLSSECPDKDLLLAVAQRLTPPRERSELAVFKCSVGDEAAFDGGGFDRLL